MDETINIFSQARIEYTKQLIDVLKDRLYDRFQEIFIDNKKNIKSFRKYLETIINWNQGLIESEKSKIIERSKCEWIDDLITAVFISHTRILTSIGTTKRMKKINLVVPKTINFIHKCYINGAREFWKNPNLFDDKINTSEYQRNIRIIELIIKESIEYTIRSSLPIKDILQNHLSSTHQFEDDKYQEDKYQEDKYRDDKYQEDIHKAGELDDRDKIIKGLLEEREQYKKQDNRKYKMEELYDNSNILINNNDKYKIDNVINIDNDGDEIIEPINDSNCDIIDNSEVNTEIVNDKYESNINLFENIDSDLKEEIKDKSIIELDIEKTEITNDSADETIENKDDVKIISDIEKINPKNDIKNIKKMNEELDTDDVETIDDLLSDINNLNENADYTLFD